MSAKKWSFRLAVAAAAAFLLAAGGIWWAIATESGARWVVARVVGFTPGLSVHDVSGTLWRGVGAEQVGFERPGRQVIIDGLHLQVDWWDSNWERLAIEQLAARGVTVTTSTERTSDSSMFPIDVPPVPLRISAAAIDVTSVGINGTVFSDVAIRRFDMDGQRYRGRSIDLVTEWAALHLDRANIVLSGDLPLATAASWATADGRWSGAGTVGGSVRVLEVEHELHGDYRVATSGSIDLSQPRQPVFDLVSTFAELGYEKWAATEGTVRVTGTTNRYESGLDLVLSYDAGISVHVAGQVEGNLERLTAIDLAGESDIGRVRVNGSAQWTPAVSADLVVTGQQVDLAAFTDAIESTVDGSVRVTGTGTDAFTVEVRRLAGNFNEYALTATGTVIRNGEQWQCRQCDAAVGDNRLRADVEVSGQQIDGSIDIDVPSMHQLLAESSGALHASGTLRGRFDRPVLAGNLNGENLVFREYAAKSVTVRSPSVTAESVDIAIAIEALSAGDRSLGGGELRASGKLSGLDVETEWVFDQFDVRLAATVGLQGNVLSGRLMQAVIDERYTGQWQLADPAPISIALDDIRVEEAGFFNDPAQIYLSRFASQPGALSADLELSGIPLRWLNQFAPPEVAVEGQADARLALRRSAAGWEGDLEWQQSGTVLHIAAADDDRYAIAIPVAIVRATAGSTGAEVMARVSADNGVEVELTAKSDDLAPEASIDADLTVTGDDWAWVSAFVPEIDEIEGSLRADLHAGGPFRNPAINGEIRLSEGKMVLPALNVPIDDIDIRVIGRAADRLELSGEARSGEGDLEVTGTVRNLLPGPPRMELRFRGEGAKVMDWPDYRIIASPDLALSGTSQQFNVAGDVRLDKAEIRVRELPEGAVRPSDDVSVVGRETNGRRSTRLTGEISIRLGDAVHVRAFGLDTNLLGNLRISLPEGRKPEAHGELTLANGFFEMYGQRLEVEHGTVLFSGALDNPFVDARVIRQVDYNGDSIRVGLDIRGRAEALNSTIFSDPAMSEAEALSYLVTGRPLATAQTADGAMLSNAAFSLGLRQAAAITNQIGQLVGLDELVLEGASQETTELVAGKQLSSDLYARYRYAVFSNIGELLLQYSLSETFSVELGVGEFQSFDIQYKIERQ